MGMTESHFALCWSNRPVLEHPLQLLCTTLQVFRRQQQKLLRGGNRLPKDFLQSAYASNHDALFDPLFHSPFNQRFIDGGHLHLRFDLQSDSDGPFKPIQSSGVEHPAEMENEIIQIVHL